MYIHIHIHTYIYIYVCRVWCAVFGAIADKNARFKGRAQQDAHELLKVLIDGLHEVIHTLHCVFVCILYMLCITIVSRS
jgi:hypothetical protein